MVTYFCDADQSNARELFQKWRRANPAGFLLTQKKRGTANLHHSRCWHFAGTHYRGPHAVTGKWKACARTIAELRAWASEREIAVHNCAHCERSGLDERSSKILPRKKYDEIVAKIMAKAKLVVDDEYEDVPAPLRARIETFRIIRITAFAKKVKELCGNQCQLCGTRIRLPNGTFYSEAHHIQPLGRPHNGPDGITNLICVCPNCHVQLDNYATPIVISQLRRTKGHKIANKYVKYHNERVRKAIPR